MKYFWWILLGAMVVSAQTNEIALFDSVTYKSDNTKRCFVVADSGAAILSTDSTFAIRHKAAFTHFDVTKACISWMGEDFEHVPHVEADNEHLLLQASLDSLDAAPKTTGFVLYCNDNTYILNVPADSLSEVSQ